MENLFENSDFLGNKLELENKTICKYCGRNIYLMPFILNDLEFCDVVCGKLYGDENDWKTYKYDKKTYDLYYKNSLLSNNAIIAYKLLRKIDIFLFPVYTDKSSINHEYRKNEYLASIVNFSNQLF